MIERYTRPALAELWSDAHRYETWLRVELAACEAMEAAGRVPAEQPKMCVGGPLASCSQADSGNRGATKHDVIAFLTMLRNSRVSRRAGFTLE